MKELIGEKEAEAVVAVVEKDVANTHNLIDVYYKIMPNKSIYFFKRYLEGEKLCLRKIADCKCGAE